jgi:hypothetical protein
VLSCLFEFRSELQIFLSDTTSDLSSRFTDEMWLSRLAYLADIFCHLNELNKSLQGFHTTPFSVHDKTKALRKIIGFVIKEVESGQVCSFPCLDSFISESEIQLNPELAANIKEHYENLIADFKQYFPENLTSEFWMRDPFSIEDILPESLTTNEKDELIELSCVGSLQQMFKKMDLTEFWLARRKEYLLISDKAVKFLLVFTYLCECVFFSVNYLKNKYRNRLSTEPDLRLKLTKIEPDIWKLCLAKQAHPSH